MADAAPSEQSAALSESPVDLSTTPQSLARAVLARRAEYVRPHRIRVKIGTWNVAACPGTDKDLAAWFVDGKGVEEKLAGLSVAASTAGSRHGAVRKTDAQEADSEGEALRLVGGDKVGLYVLGLQEIVDLNLSKEYMGRAVYTGGSDSGPTEKWKAAIEAAMPPGYELVSSDQMTGLLLLIYASPEVAATVSNVSTRQVGTGLLGYFGNKGAITTRILLGETTRMVFVNSHLASGAAPASLERRYWDVAQILAKTQFPPVVQAGVAEDEGEKIGDEDFAFWFGDLNFRLDGLPGADIRRLLTLHARGEYNVGEGDGLVGGAPLEGEGVIVMKDSGDDDQAHATTMPSNHSANQSIDSEDTSLPDPDDFPEDPSQDPTSLQATLDSLLPHDQLRKSIATGRAFHEGWREGHISFLPTYKYDVGTVGLLDSSEKQRAPSWCDRILYRTRKDKLAYDKKASEEAKARQKDDEMKSRGIDQDDDVLFSYDPDTDGDESAKDQDGAHGSGGGSSYEYDEYDENEDTRSVDVVTKEGAKDHISLDLYTSHQRIMSSDHKPLVSVFTLDYDAVVPEIKAKVHAEVARELDRAENEGRPAITVIIEGGDSSAEGAVALGDVGFLEKKTCSLTIANTGGAPARVNFVEKPSVEDGDDGLKVSWLNASFQLPGGGTSVANAGKTVVVDPGETLAVLVEAQVTTVSDLRHLNDNSARLDEVLVLRVEDGRDHFIPVRATWQPSSFGRSLEELIRVPDGGLRTFVRKKKIKGAIPYDLPVQCSAPKELFRLTEALQTLAERCAADETMLDEVTVPKEAGWPFDLTSATTLPTPEMSRLEAILVAAIDTDANMLDMLPAELTSSCKLELVAAVLVLFLASLTDGLIPTHLWAKLSASLPVLTSLPSTAWPDTKTQILDVLSSAPNHNIAFVFLTATLSRVASELSPSKSAHRGDGGHHHATAVAIGIARRLSLRKSGNAEQESVKRRRARERRYAEIFGPLACRGAEVGAAKGTRERERAVMEMFLRRDDDG